MATDGTCDARFAKVQERFEASFARGDEVGASFTAVVEGETLVDPRIISEEKADG